MLGNSLDHHWLFYPMTRALRLTIVLTALSGIAHAQITLDGSLGPGGALIGPNFVIPSSVGQIRGGNLFHSFGLFNVLTNQSATFTGPNSISNILSRVTGGQSSVIDGLIRSNIPRANLFLINPAGLIFGPNARLGVSGSFHATTADYLKFTDRAKFHADLARQSVLSSAPVSAFGFLSQSPAGIDVFQGVLQVPEGQTLSLVGGDLFIVGDPAVDISTLFARAGKTQLASVASPGEVPLNIQEMNLTDFQRLGEINLVNSAVVDASGNGAGRVVIRGGKLLVDSSAVFSENLGDIDGIGRGVDIAVSGEATIRNGSIIAAESFRVGRGRDIRLAAGTLGVADSVVSANTFRTGDAGDVVIEVKNVNLTSEALITASTDRRSSGNAGDVVVLARDLTVTGGAQIGSFTRGSGDGGTITVATDTLSLAGKSKSSVGLLSSGIFSGTELGSSGNAGKIVVDAKNVTVTGGAQINSNTLGSGNGGTVRVTASELVSISGTGSGFFSTACTCFDTSRIISATGNAGEITVAGPGSTAVPTLTMADGGKISVETSPKESGAGRAGSISLNANRFSLTGGAQVVSSTNGAGQGGSVTVNATDSASISGQGTGLFSTASGTGPGGTIKLQTAQLQITDAGVVSANSTGTAASATAGNINVVVSDRLRMENGSMMTEARVAAGGNISITSTGSLLHMTNSQVTTSVRGGEGGGGDITIGSQPHPFDFLVLNNSGIHANAFGGPGGKIDIFARTFLSSLPIETAVTATSERNVPGTVNIQAAITNVSGLLQPLPENIFQATALLHQSCAARFSGGKLSSLAVGSRDGLPLEPGGFMPSPLYRLGSQPDTSITQRNASSKSDRLTLASVKPPFSVNWPCTK